MGRAKLTIAHDLLEAEQKVEPEEEQDRAKAALSELFQDVKTDNMPVLERVVNDIDEIVRTVRFTGWQETIAGERNATVGGGRVCASSGDSEGLSPYPSEGLTAAVFIPYSFGSRVEVALVRLLSFSNACPSLSCFCCGSTAH